LNTCQWGECANAYDIYELNNYKFISEYLGWADEGEAIAPVTNAWIHDSNDTDWYNIYLYESGSWTDLSMHFKVTLTGGAGLHEVCVFWDEGFDGTTNTQVCEAGEGQINLDTGDLDGLGGTDDGVAYIKVTGEASCAPYKLTLAFD